MVAYLNIRLQFPRTQPSGSEIGTCVWYFIFKTALLSNCTVVRICLLKIQRIILTFLQVFGDQLKPGLSRERRGEAAVRYGQGSESADSTTTLCCGPKESMLKHWVLNGCEEMLLVNCMEGTKDYYRCRPMWQPMWLHNRCCAEWCHMLRSAGRFIVIVGRCLSGLQSRRQWCDLLV